MKKTILIIISLIILIVVGTFLFFIIRPNLSKTYKLDAFNVSIKIPYAYEEVENESLKPKESSDTTQSAKDRSNIIINLYNEYNGISITVLNLQGDFWSSGDTISRMDEYTKVISSANYDSNIRNVKMEAIEKLDSKIGRVEMELAKQNTENKSVTLITDETIGNLVIEIIGTKESFENYSEEIEKIINSVKI